MASKSPASNPTPPSSQTSPQSSKSTDQSAKQPAAQKSGHSPDEPHGESGVAHEQEGNPATMSVHGPATALLIADHRAVEKLFSEYETAKEARRREIIEIASHALILHTTLEEEIFYPACREHFSEDAPLDEAQVEHDGVKILIIDLLHGAPQDPYRDAKFRVLAEQVRHHVREEEQTGGIFSKARACGVDTQQLASQLTDRRSQLEAGGPLPDPVPRALCRFAQAGQSGQDPRHSNGRGEEMRGQSRYVEEKEMASYQQYRDRDEYGRFTSHDDDYGSSRRGNDRPRDEDGRFMSSGRSSGRHEDDRDERHGRSGQQSYRRDDDDRQSGGRSHGGWFGDSRGHSEAARRGWENPDHGPSGWYGDREGHAEASRRGWDHRQDHDDDRGRYRSQAYEDDRSGSRSYRGDRDDDDRRHGGWSGDPRGHSEAARRGWENRR